MIKTKKMGLARAKQLWQADPEYAMKVANWIQILHAGNIKLKSRYKEPKGSPQQTVAKGE